MDKDRVADVALNVDDVEVKDDVAKERNVFEAVIKVYDMHQNYEKMLGEPEMKLYDAEEKRLRVVKERKEVR